MPPDWDVEADVVVVGFGAAGACAALEAAAAGCSVLILDRFGGGGATALSGGVVYAGGGTAQQRAAGVTDTPEAMLPLLRQRPVPGRLRLLRPPRRPPRRCGNRYATQDVTGGAAVEPFDPTKPNIARVWDYWLGGKDNFAADRELAEKMLAVHPPTAKMARENRRFLGRAVSYVANRGIRQFIDVGAGLPTAVNTHDIARHVDPDVRVAYVDNDPIVISHARGLLAKSPGVIAVPGDMRDPGRILADPGLTDLIDLADPVCVILSGVLHFAPAATARGVAAAFTRAIVPGSYLIISVGSGSPSESANFTSEYTAARVYIHSLEEIQSFFDGLDLLPPGVVPVRLWTGDTPAPDHKARTATFLAGVARKP